MAVLHRTQPPASNIWGILLNDQKNEHWVLGREEMRSVCLGHSNNMRNNNRVGEKSVEWGLKKNTRRNWATEKHIRVIKRDREGNFIHELSKHICHYHRHENIILVLSGGMWWGSSRQKITASCQRAKPLRAMGQHQSHCQEIHLLVKGLAVWPPKPSESIGFKTGDGHVNSAVPDNRSRG